MDSQNLALPASNFSRANATLLFEHVHHAGVVHGVGSGTGVVGGKYFAGCYISKWGGSLSTVH